MANLPIDNWIDFTAIDSGTALSPTSGFSNFAINATVEDNNNDDNIDSGDTAAISLTYSGYTINIGGHTYAIFHGTGNNYYIPYSTAIEDLSVLDGTAVSQPITQTGDNAVVYNCFLTGTMIETSDGPCAIETLKHGDLIFAADGRLLPLRWLARMEVKPRAVNLPLDQRPVRIAANAFGHGFPSADLCISGDHALIIKGLLINASALINHNTVRELRADEMPDHFTYWHLELDSHEAILANGIPSESFVDYLHRDGFDNYDEYLALNGCDRLIREMEYPRIRSPRHLPKRLARRLGILKAAA